MTDPIHALDLSQSAWIEASAGTGKTYNIERLFLRLVAEKDRTPGEILMLSFTRKTADELRERIRARLKKESGPEAEFSWDTRQKSRIAEAHLLCDEMAVHTMHGFCQKALLTHALEMRMPFMAELRDEKELVPEALDALLRGPWSNDPGFLRTLAGIEEKPEKRDQRLCSLALSFNPERGDRLHLRPDPNWMGELSEQLRPAGVRLEKACASVDRGDRKGENDVFTRLLELIPKLVSLSDLDKAFALADFFADLHGSLKPVKTGFGAVLHASVAGNVPWMELAEQCDFWRGLRKELQERRKVFQAALKRVPENEIIAKAAGAIRLRMGRDKGRLGLVTYADMESKLIEAVRKNPDLAFRLGAGFKACVVDEFQDTDPLQWELLKALCEGGRKIPLFLVGDPKQAIYGFRGGDLGTYLSARRHFNGLAREGLARGFPLETNFRSSVNLIAALNSVFPHPKWFGPAPSVTADPYWHLPSESREIVFTPALAPAGSDRNTDSPVILRDFKSQDGTSFTKAEYGKALRKWISSQMRILSPNIPYKGMAVLTRTNPEAMAMERHLRREGIPCRLHRAANEWEGGCADALRMLLELLESAAEPAAQARILLLPFLRMEGAEPPGIPEECPALIREWARLADLRRWPEFFHSVLFDSGYAYRLAAKTGQDSEFQTLIALTKVLSAEGLRHGCSLRAMRERFNALRDDEENTGLPLPPPGDQEEGGVTLMTLHGSKGLEFRAVFLAGMSQGVTGKSHITVRDENGFVHALDTFDPDMKTRSDFQSCQEDKRLYYVGFTRAKEKLYVPLLPEKSKNKALGPLGSFAAEALREAAEKNPELFRIDADEIVSPVVVSSVIGAAKRGVAPTEWPDRDPAEPVRESIWSRRRRLASYSQLVRNIIPTREEEISGLDRDEAADPEIEPVQASTLPAGATTGTALHSLLETLDFTLVANTENPSAYLEAPGIQEAINRQITEHGLPDNCAQEIASLIWHSLRMEIPDPASADFPAFRLVDATEHRSEVGFLMRTNGNIDSLPEETSLRNGFLQGGIDLVFRHSGRYYLLDWKSNRLDGYGWNHVEASMREHNYGLQLQLYSVVLDRWLQSRLPGYDPEKHFGGAIWMFLRGAPQAAATGIFSGHIERPTVLELREEFPRRLRESMGLS